MSKKNTWIRLGIPCWDGYSDFGAVDSLQK